jgi:hypothetical protein
MRQLRIAIVLCISLLTVPSLAWSKGETIKIVIEGDDLLVPIEITDPEVVGQFSIWNGPGVGVRDPLGEPDPSAYVEPEGSVGRFIDWPKGFANTHPRHLQRLEVTFFVGVPRETGNTRKFVFAYEIDWNNEDGYIFLPMWKNDLIWHGVELNWLHAHKRWNETIMPIVAQQSVEGSHLHGQSELNCTVGEGLLHADGTIEFQLLDEAGNRSSRWRYEKSTQWYEKVRDHIGDVTPEQEIPISCWPTRS